MTVAKWFPWQPSFPSVRDFLLPFTMISLSLHVPHLCHINIAPIFLPRLQPFNLHLCLTYSDLRLSLSSSSPLSAGNFPLTILNFSVPKTFPTQHLTGPDTEVATPRLQHRKNLFPLPEQQKSFSA
jgi:hypothetical protein